MVSPKTTKSNHDGVVKSHEFSYYHLIVFMKHQNNTMNSPDRSQWLDKVYSARNNTELAEGYDAWAQDYEQDVLSFGYKIPAIMSGLIGRYLPSGTGRILDAGVGTGILGENLAMMGYKDLIGIDLSAGMLEVARKKGVYRNLLQMILGQNWTLRRSRIP